MMDSKALLAALRERGVTNAQIARALGLPDPRITEMYAGKRTIKLDEAKRLVDAFQLERERPRSEISADNARLLVLHILQKVTPAGPVPHIAVEELAADLVAFLRFAQRLDQGPSQDAALGFLAGRQSDVPPR